MVEKSISDIQYLVEHGYALAYLDGDDREMIKLTLKGKAFIDAVSLGLIKRTKLGLGDYDDRLFDFTWNACESAFRNAAE